MKSRSSLNHIFRTVWNKALGAMVAVAEIATGRGQGASSGAGGSGAAIPSRLAALPLCIALAWGAVAPDALANPVGGVVIKGQATFDATQANKLLVTTQNAPGTNQSAINWQSFSIPAGNTTYFQQPSTNSTSINRVVTNTPSQLFGTLGSNGNLVLVNQAGITVGAGAVVDTAGFTASALNMSDADALTGRLRFGDGSANGGAVAVHGNILARGGDVVAAWWYSGGLVWLGTMCNRVGLYGVL
jgi:filamentous hemagglutinin family protein